MKKTLSIAAVLFALFPAFSYASTIYSQPVFSTLINNATTHYILRECLPVSSTGNVEGFAIYPGSGIDLGTTAWTVYFISYIDPSCTLGTTFLGSLGIGALQRSTRQFFDVSAAGVNLTGVTYLRVEVYDQGGAAPGSSDQSFGTTGAFTTPGDIDNNAFLELYDTPSDPQANTTTRVVSTTPTYGATISTSTTATLGAEVYVNPLDYESGMYLEIRYALFSAFQSAVGTPDSLYKKIDFPITSAGDFVFSTTTDISQAGQYQMISAIRSTSLLNSALNFLGFGQFASGGVSYSTTTTFTAAHSTGYDIFVASTTESVQNYLASSTVSLASCSTWTSFNLGDCLNLMFVPQTQPIIESLDNFKNGFLSYMPWGYVTRFLTIVSGNGTTTPPSINVIIPLGDPHQPGYLNGPFTLNTMDMLQGGADELNTIHTSFGGDLTFQQVFEPFVKLSIALALMIYMIQDMMHFRGGKSGKVIGYYNKSSLH